MSDQEAHARQLLVSLALNPTDDSAIPIIAAALDAAEQRGEAGLSLSVQNDALGISELLDDSTRERQMYHKLVYDIRKALPDALDVPLLELPNAIRAALDAAAREALEQAAKELPTVHLCSSCDLDADEWIEREAEQKRNEVIRGWLKSRADALSGRHEEETKTKS